MDQSMLLWVIAAFVLVAAIALCIQAGLLFGLYVTTKKHLEQLNPLIPKFDALIDSTKTTVEQSRKQIIDITTKTNQILDSTKGQLPRLKT